MIKLFVFLGNPGERYRKTRHNVAWLFVETLFSSQDLTWGKRFDGEIAKASLKTGVPLFLLKPLTFMNQSGRSVAPMARFFKIAPEEILVIHDEIELPFGTLSYQRGGGLGGHNGLKSLRDHLQTDDFLRYRIGVGRPIGEQSVHDWVLGNFSTECEARLPELFREAEKFLRISLEEEKVPLYRQKYVVDWAS